MPDRTMPVVIGMTEKALGRVLDQALAGANIADRDEWVRLNTAAVGTLAPDAQAKLDSARLRVASATAALVDGMDEAELKQAALVLDRIRVRAEAAVAQSSRPG